VVFQVGPTDFAFGSKIILVAKDYSIRNVEGVDISENPHIGEGRGLDDSEHPTGIGYGRMFRVTSRHVVVLRYVLAIT